MGPSVCDTLAWPKKARSKEERETTRVTGVRASGTTRRVAHCARAISRPPDNIRPPRNEVWLPNNNLTDDEDPKDSFVEHASKISYPTGAAPAWAQEGLEAFWENAPKAMASFSEASRQGAFPRCGDGTQQRAKQGKYRVALIRADAALVGLCWACE